MKITIVSDFHVRDENDPIYSKLCRILEGPWEKGDYLVILGDLFDLLVGDQKIFRNKYRRFFELLRGISRKGVKIHYIEGNHDFHLDDTFRRDAFVDVHDSEFCLDVEGRKFFFAHGDLVDESDTGYLALRAFFRSLFLRTFVKCAPGTWIDAIGKWSSRQSQKKSQAYNESKSPEQVQALRGLYHEYSLQKFLEGFDFVVMGHCHDLDEWFFEDGGQKHQYINMGYPPADGKFLQWYSGDATITRQALPDE